MKTKETNKVIWYGIGSGCQHLFESVPKLLDYIDCFIDEHGIESEFLGKKVKKPNIFQTAGTNPVVVSFMGDEAYGRYKWLQSEYDLPEKQVWYAREWVADILSSNQEILLLPKKVRLEACTICQLACPSCYMRKSNYGSMGKGYLHLSDFRKFVEENRFIQKIELSNSGEVFLNPELLEILEYAHEKNIEITISNGTNFNSVTEKVLEGLVRYNVKRITFSIDGASQKIYSMYRVNGNFNTVIQNIKKVIQYKRKYGSSHPKMIWQYVLMEHNEHEAGEAKHMAEELGIDIFYKLDWEGKFEPQDPEKLEKITGLHIFNRNEWQKRNGRKYTADICRQMMFCPQINYDGRLLGCCGVYLNDWDVNVFEDGLAKSLNKGNYFHALIDFLKGKYNGQLDKICQKCSAGIHEMGEKQILEL